MISNETKDLLKNCTLTDCSMESLHRMLLSERRSREEQIARLKREVEAIDRDIERVGNKVGVNNRTDNTPSKRTWRLSAVLTQIVMDYDSDWSIKFWFVCKKFRNHSCVRRSVDMYVY